MLFEIKFYKHLTNIEFTECEITKYFLVGMLDEFFLNKIDRNTLILTLI